MGATALEVTPTGVVRKVRGFQHYVGAACQWLLNCSVILVIVFALVSGLIFGNWIGLAAYFLAPILLALVLVGIHVCLLGRPKYYPGVTSNVGHIVLGRIVLFSGVFAGAFLAGLGPWWVQIVAVVGFGNICLYKWFRECDHIFD